MPTPPPPAPSALQGTTRRQARCSMHRAATCLDQCVQGINPPWSPAPPHVAMGLPAKARPGRKGRRRIAFFNGGMERHAEKPVEFELWHLALPGSTKASAAFARFELPRVVCFLPRVGLFCPRVHFSAGRAFSLSFFLFSEERKMRKDGDGATASGRSTGLKSRKNLYPRVGDSFHGFFVDAFLSKSEHWRGLAARQGLIHASTGCFACGQAEPGQAGGARG